MQSRYCTLHTFGKIPLNQAVICVYVYIYIWLFRAYNHIYSLPTASKWKALHVFYLHFCVFQQLKRDHLQHIPPALAGGINNGIHYLCSIMVCLPQRVPRGERTFEAAFSPLMLNGKVANSLFRKKMCLAGSLTVGSSVGILNAGAHRWKHCVLWIN